MSRLERGTRFYESRAKFRVVQIEKQEGGGGANGIEEGIERGGTTGSDEGLMNFIEAGIGGGQEPGREGGGPIPAATMSAQAAIEQQEENKIFAEVGELADDMVNEFDLLMREGGMKPKKYGLEEGAGMGGGE